MVRSSFRLTGHGKLCVVQSFIDAVEGVDDIIVDFDRLVGFDEVMEWSKFLGEAGYVITVRINKSNIPSFWRQFLILWGAMPSGETVLPWNSTSLAPNCHLAIVGPRPASLTHWKTTHRLIFSSSAVWVAIPMSSTYWAFLSAFMTRSRYSLIKLEKAERGLLSPCVSRRYASIRLAKLNARSSTDTVLWWKNGTTV